MKIGQFIHILAILLLICGFALPVSAAGNETTDAATGYYNAGVNLLEAKQYERAIAAFDQALAENITMIQQSDALLYTYQNKGYAQIQLNNFTAAIQTIDQGLALYENDEKLWYNKGYALFRLGQYQDALNAYDNVLRINNQSVPALNNKGDTFFQMGRYQDAIDAYTMAIVIDPENSYAAEGLAKARSAAPTATLTSITPLPTTTQAPLSLLTIVAALSVMGFIPLILQKKR